MNQSKLIENILKASKTIGSSHGTANYIVTSSTVASILKGIEIRSERKRKLKKILWN
jgi:hypothetical protein